MGLAERSVVVQGTRIRFLRTPEAEAPSGLPLLLIHGYTARAETWKQVWGPLSARHPLIIPDLPNHFRSGPFPDKHQSMDRYRKVLGAFLQSQGVARCGVIGNSIGGMIAGMLALDYPDRVEKLVMLDPDGMSPTFPKYTRKLFTPLILPAYLWAPTEEKLRRFFGPACFHDPKLLDEGWTHALFEEWQVRRTRMRYLAAGMAVGRHDPSLYENLEKIRCPTLFLWGRQDRQFYVDLGEAASKRIPNAKLTVFESCGHMPQEEKPRETAEAILQFLDGVAPTSR